MRLEMERAAIRPRFERARDACLSDATLQCTLISSTISIDETPAYPSSYAQLVLLLPHDKVEGYSDALLADVAGASAVTLRSRSSQAGNVTNQAADVARRLTQVTDYRNRLGALFARADAKVDDLIKLAGELSNAQSTVEQWTAQRRDVGERVAKERLTISFTERPGAADALRPLKLASGAALATFSESAGAMLLTVIGTLPWLPVLAVVLFAVVRAWRMVRGRKAG